MTFWCINIEDKIVILHRNLYQRKGGEMSYRPVVDKDQEHAKECLDCGKIFYVGETCPFCVVTIIHCVKCQRAKASINNGEWTNRLKAINDALGQKPKKIKHADTVCEDCKTEDLCKTGPVAVCNER